MTDKMIAMPCPDDDELRRDAERMRIAVDAPNLHAQVYLYCRLHAATHDEALDIAHDAEIMHGSDRVSEGDLRIILEEIRDALAA